MSHSSTHSALVTNSSVIPDSTYPPLEPPDKFESQIPAHLLASASDAEEYIMSQLSILQQSSKWSMDAIMVLDSHARLTNGKIRRAEANIADIQEEKQVKEEGAKLVLKGWKLLVAVGSVIGGVIWFLLKAYALIVHGVS